MRHGHQFAITRIFLFTCIKNTIFYQRNISKIFDKDIHMNGLQG